MLICVHSWTVDEHWPGVGIRRRQNHGPLTLSASHTSTVAEQLTAVLGVMQSRPRSRRVVDQLIVDQLDSITHLISSPASSLPHVSLRLSHMFHCSSYEV